MTQAEVNQWFIDNGVPHVLNDEAGYVYGKYGPGGESDGGDVYLQQVLAQSLPHYMQRELSGGDRDKGGYSTDLNDPEISIGGYSAPARYDSNPYELFPSAGHSEYTGPRLAGPPGGFLDRSGGGSGGGPVQNLDQLRQPNTSAPVSPEQVRQPDTSGPAVSPEQVLAMIQRLTGENTGGQMSLDQLAAELRRLGVDGSGFLSPTQMGGPMQGPDGTIYYDGQAYPPGTFPGVPRIPSDGPFGGGVAQKPGNGPGVGAPAPFDWWQQS